MKEGLCVYALSSWRADPLSRGSSLDLLVPGLLGPLPVSDPGSLPKLPILEKTMARGYQHEAPDGDLETTLMSLFGFQRDTDCDYPHGALSRIGDGFEADERFWFLAEPVLLRPDKDRLLLFDSMDLSFSVGEAEALAGLCIEHFRDEGLRLEIADAHRWYLSTNLEPRLETSNLGDVVGRNMDLFLPSGPDARRWRSLTNEIQMLWHDSRVNRMREEAGKLPINGIWLSGGGVLTTDVSRPYDRIYAHHPLAAGLAATTGIPCTGLPDKPDKMFGEAGRVLAIYPELVRPVWNASIQDWVETAVRLDDWVKNLLACLREKSLDEVRIYPCNGRFIQLTPRGLRRFWKRQLPLIKQFDQLA